MSEKKLIELLKEKNPQTATELANQLNVSNRTIYRWAEKLSEMGIDIVSTKGRNGGILLKDDKVDMSQFQNETTPKKEKNMTKTKTSNMSTFDDSWLEVSFSEEEKASQLDKKYDTCKKSILESKVLSFSYNLPDGKVLNCTTEPVRLYLSDYQWHILAWIRKAEKYKLFKLENMTSLELLDETFSRTADFKIQDALN